MRAKRRTQSKCRGVQKIRSKLNLEVRVNKR